MTDSERNLTEAAGEEFVDVTDVSPLFDVADECVLVERLPDE